MVRALQFEPRFKVSPDWQAAFMTRHSELLTRFLGDSRLAVRIARRPFRHILRKYNKRWELRREDEIIERAKKCDLVSMVKSAGIRLYDRLSKLEGPGVVMDINDACWMPCFGWTDLPETLQMVHGVICENEYIAKYARCYNNNVHVVPDSPQIEVFDPLRPTIRRDEDKVVLGWIGGAQNIAPLHQIREPLEALFSHFPKLHLRVVGADESRLPKFKHVRYSCRATYDQSTMVREVLRFDIGLFPLLRNEDGLARGTLKAKVYMSGGAAVVADHFGENPGLIRDGVNGMLASSLSDWHHKLQSLISDRCQRLRIAEQGLSTIRENFTVSHIFNRLIAAYDHTLALRTGVGRLLAE
jgi:glycosyltransferase involved in cell wall biosynthesis